MSFTEIHIDYSWGVFARYHHASNDSPPLNYFDTADQPRISGFTGSEIETAFTTLLGEGILQRDSGTNILAPLTAFVVLPDGDGPFPLHVMIHGMFRAFFSNGRREPEGMSYQGYQYLQRHLANEGIASVSVNVNMVNLFNSPGRLGDDELQRLIVAFQHLLLLRSLSGVSNSGTSPLFVRRSTGLSPLADVLAITGSTTAGSPENKLLAAKAQLDRKLNFSNLSFMGHSRGGSSVALISGLFGLTAAPPPSPGPLSPGASPPPPSSSGLVIPTIPRPQDMHSAPTEALLVDLVAMMGNPPQSAIKCIIALEPADEENASLNFAETFYLLVIGSHDEDVGTPSINAYDAVGSPRASIFTHGSTHKRFNTVWRSDPDGRRAINRNIACQSPIRILSNAGHEELARIFLGNALIATQKNRPLLLKFFTGETRATTIHQDIERQWRFPFPFNASPGILLLDSRVTAVIDASGASVALSKTQIAYSYQQGIARRDPASNEDTSIYAHTLPVFRITKPAAVTHKVPITLSSSDNLSAYTHFSFRYAKEHNPFSPAERASEPLRNFSLRLFSGTTQVGQTIDGNSIPSILQRTYPIRLFLTEGDSCGTRTVILLQTQEVPLSQFFTTAPTPTQLNSIDKIEIALNPSRRSGNDTYIFVDLLLTNRVIT